MAFWTKTAATFRTRSEPGGSSSLLRSQSPLRPATPTRIRMIRSFASAVLLRALKRVNRHFWEGSSGGRPRTAGGSAHRDRSPPPAVDWLGSGGFMAVQLVSTRPRSQPGLRPAREDRLWSRCAKTTSRPTPASAPTCQDSNTAESRIRVNAAAFRRLPQPSNRNGESPRSSTRDPASNQTRRATPRTHRRRAAEPSTGVRSGVNRPPAPAPRGRPAAGGATTRGPPPARCGRSRASTWE